MATQQSTRPTSRIAHKRTKRATPAPAAVAPRHPQIDPGSPWVMTDKDGRTYNMASNNGRPGTRNYRIKVPMPHPCLQVGDVVVVAPDNEPTEDCTILVGRTEGLFFVKVQDRRDDDVYCGMAVEWMRSFR